MITALFDLVGYLINLIVYALIIAAIVQTLIAFGVLDTRNRLVWQVAYFLYRVTEPLLRPIRNLLPNFGNVDLSPLVLILLLNFVAKPLLSTLYLGIVTGRWSVI